MCDWLALREYGGSARFGFFDAILDGFAVAASKQDGSTLRMNGVVQFDWHGMEAGGGLASGGPVLLFSIPMILNLIVGLIELVHFWNNLFSCPLIFRVKI